MRPFLTFLLFYLLGCSGPGSKRVSPEPNISASATPESNKADPTRRRQKVFSLISSYPFIEDTANFIRELKEFGDVEGCWYPEKNEPEARISYYKKIKLHGSNSEHVLLEYEYGSGANVCFPYKYQFLLTLQGKLTALLDAVRFELVEVFPDDNPLLLTVISSSRGNGGHRLYKFSADTLENIYEGYTDYQVKTYDAEENEIVFKPNELKSSFVDINRDGYNDLVFSGKLLLIQGLTKDSLWYEGPYSISNPYKVQSVRYVFLYETKAGHFAESKTLSQGNRFR